MKAAGTFLAAVLLLAAIGCEGPKEPEDTTRFEKEIDGPPCMFAAAGDEQLLADQAEISRQVAERPATALPAATATVAPPAAATLPPGTNPIESARSRLQGAATAVTAGRREQVADLFGDEEAAALRRLLALSDLQAKARNLEQLVRDRFGDGFVDKLNKMGSGPSASGTAGPPAGPGPSALAPKPEDLFANFLDVARLKFTADGQDVIVTRPDGMQSKLVYTDKGWKFELDPLEKQMFLITADMAEGGEKLIDAMTGGINDGSITSANFDEKAKELGEKLFQPVAERFAQLRVEITKKAFEKMGAPGPGPVPGGPAPSGTVTRPPTGPLPGESF